MKHMEAEDVCRWKIPLVRESLIAGGQFSNLVSARNFNPIEETPHTHKKNNNKKNEIMCLESAKAFT